MNDDASMVRGWPSLALTALIVAAAVYSFSPRPAPPFAPTQIYPDRLIVNGLAHSNGRYIAVGEGGVILTADDPDGPWRQAPIAPPRGSTLTRVRMLGPQLAIAVGHDGWIVRSEDGGATWKEAAFTPERSEPLLDVAGPFDGTMFAFGAFGRFLVSTDEGKTWQAQPLVEIGKEAPPPAAPADPFGDGAAPLDQGIADRHLNAMAQLADGSLLLVGERGLIAHSRDSGRSWDALPEIYAGSFYGVLPLPEGAVLVFGMRGNAFVSSDLKRWTRSETPNINSLFGGAVTDGGRIVLVGASNAVMVSDDGGRTFTQVSERDRFALATVLPLDSGAVLAGGEGGVAVRRLAATGGQP